MMLSIHLDPHIALIEHHPRSHGVCQSAPIRRLGSANPDPVVTRSRSSGHERLFATEQIHPLHGSQRSGPPPRPATDQSGSAPGLNTLVRCEAALASAD